MTRIVRLSEAELEAETGNIDALGFSRPFVNKDVHSDSDYRT